jgi:hypothetical protein
MPSQAPIPNGRALDSQTYMRANLARKRQLDGALMHSPGLPSLHAMGRPNDRQ